MNRLALFAAALMTSACAIENQLDTASVTLAEDALQVNVKQLQEDACPTIDSRTAVRVNGAPASFSDIGGGSCFQAETSGVGVVGFGPPKPGKVWVCACRPAVVRLPADRAALDVELCLPDAPCARASWPARTPMPVATPAPRDRDDLPLVINITPAVPVKELQPMLSLEIGENSFDRQVLSWADGQVTVPARWANERGLTVKLRRFEDLKPTTCEGLQFCGDRETTEVTKRLLTP